MNHEDTKIRTARLRDGEPPTEPRPLTCRLDPRSRGHRTAFKGFTLIELLVVVGVIGVLLAIILPSLRAAREQAQRVACASNLRQLGVGVHMYAAEHRGLLMPLAYSHQWPVVYWWGLDAPDDPDSVPGASASGFLGPYLQADLHERGVYECPAQSPGTYDRFQGQSGRVTSTYGYNGYFLSPPQTPGWSGSIGHRPWQNLDELRMSDRVFMFADSMIVQDGQLKNSALLDPPWLFQPSGLPGAGGSAGAWIENTHPTTSFRHGGSSVVVHVDGHARAHAPDGGRMAFPRWQIGSVGTDNDPRYVPDWREW